MAEKKGANYVSRMGTLGLLELREAFNPSKDSVAKDYFYHRDDDKDRQKENASQSNNRESISLDQLREVGQKAQEAEQQQQIQQQEQGQELERGGR